MTDPNELPEGEPILFTLPDGTPATEADLDAGIRMAARLHEHVDSAIRAALVDRDQIAIPYHAAQAGAVVLRQAIHDGMTMRQLEGVVTSIIAAALDATGLVLVNPSWLDRKIELAEGMITNSQSALDDMRRHLDTMRSPQARLRAEQAARAERIAREGT